ncbi:MAG TPA: asparaginase [Vicinamibacterales bacterium]|nr:asparaginase [Vicinamibacterales bacterium]
MIGILFTGGTISMKLDPLLGAAVPAFGGADILAQAPGLESVAEIEVEDFSRLPGPHVSPEQMWRLARRAAAWLDRPDVDGLVITHGTDTIEETAYLLDLVLISDKPVVLVGAMRTVSDAGWDGPANLTSAVRVAASPEARGQGVLVVMDDHVLPAREARKVHTESSGSFATPEFGPLGQVDAGVVRFRRRALPRPDWLGAGASGGLRIGHLETAVGLFQVYTGMESDAVVPFIGGRAKGLAIVAFGRGNVPPAVMPTLETAIAAGMIITISSRCVAGRVSPRYGYEGGGMQLKRIGAILAGDLSGAKARLLQMVALGGSTSAADARGIIERAIA